MGIQNNRLHEKIDNLPPHVLSEIESICPEDLFLISAADVEEDPYLLDEEIYVDDVADVTTPWMSWCLR